MENAAGKSHPGVQGRPAIVNERMSRLRRVIFADTCRWLHRELRSPGDQLALQARAHSLAVKEASRMAHNAAAGAHRAWLVQFLCSSVYTGHAAPAIDVQDPPIADMARDPRVMPGVYKRFLQVCRSAGNARDESEAESEGESIDVIDGPLPDLDELAQMHRASIERARTCDEVIGECEAEVSRCSAAIDAATARAAQAKNNLLAASVQLSTATRTHVEAIAEEERMQAALRDAESEQRATCALCGRRGTLQSMRRLTLCCGHLCCLDCLCSTLPANLHCAVDSDAPLLCPGCAAHRPPPPVVHVYAAVAEAVPPEAHSMVDPLALVLTGTGDTTEATERDEWKPLIEGVARQQVTFGDFVSSRVEGAGRQRARLSRCPRCSTFNAHGLSCYATGAARCINPRCAQLYCSRCGAIPFHFGLPCPATGV
eukprot:m51a1_g7853 hypothetical protein (428) ;mRNA; f:237831-239386